MEKEIILTHKVEKVQGKEILVETTEVLLELIGVRQFTLAEMINKKPLFDKLKKQSDFVVETLKMQNGLEVLTSKKRTLSLEEYEFVFIKSLLEKATFPFFCDIFLDLAKQFEITKN